MRNTGIYPASRLRVTDYFQIVDHVPSLKYDVTYRVNKVVYHPYRESMHLIVETPADQWEESVQFEVNMYLDDIVQIMRE